MKIFDPLAFVLALVRMAAPAIAPRPPNFAAMLHHAGRHPFLEEQQPPGWLAALARAILALALVALALATLIAGGDGVP